MNDGLFKKTSFKFLTLLFLQVVPYPNSHKGTLSLLFEGKAPTSKNKLNMLVRRVFNTSQETS
jgi:hypothetical protein